MILERVSVDQIFGESSSEGLGSRSAKSGYHSTITQVAKFVLSTLSTLILARLLTPDDFGLIAMVAVFLNFASMFKDAGLSMATVQRDKITQEEISGLFWINTAISIILALLMIAIAPLVVSFYGREEVGLIMVVLSISFFVSGTSIQRNALLQRLLRFDLIGIIQVAAQAIGLIIAVVLASYGFEYMVLVVNTFITTVFITVLTIYYVPWKPSLTFNITKVKEMLIFGGDITGFNVINYFSRNGDNILIGKFIGSEELGIYSKAYQIFMMPVKQVRIPINSVTIPVLSKLQNEPERYKAYCFLIVELLAIISIPLTLICYLEAEFIINLMLGPGWEKAIPVFRVLALYGALQVILGIRGSIMVSLSLTRRYLWMGVIYAVVNVISFIIGLQYGIIGVATAFVSAQYILFIPSLYYSFYKTPFQVKDFLKSVYPQVTIAVILILVHFILKSRLEWNIYWSLLSIIIIGISYFGFNYLRVEFREKIFSIIKQIRS